MTCAKCRQAVPLSGDSWCIGCSAWETIGTELTSHWHCKALRSVAGAVTVGALTTILSLRGISSSLQSAGDSRAAVGGSGRARSANPTREQAAAEDKKKEAEQEVKGEEESSEYESESEEAAPATSAKASPATKPPEPAHPPPGRENREEPSRKRRREGDRRPLPRKRTERGRRSGRKHQALHRQLDNPNLVVHRQQSAAYWDSHSQLGGVDIQPEGSRDGRRR